MNATGFETHFTKNFTEIELSLHKSDEVLQEWKYESRPGFIVIVTLLIIVLGVLSLGPTIYGSIRKILNR